MLLELTNISEAIEITVIDIVRVSQYVLNSSGSESVGLSLTSSAGHSLFTTAYVFCLQYS